MTHPYLAHLQCPICDRRYALEAVTYTCRDCGSVGTLDMVYDFEALREALAPAAANPLTRATPGQPSMWRYRPLLPVLDDAHIPALPVGWTPLVPAERLAERYELAELWLKDDGRNPTASLKDRASAMVAARAREIGAPVVTTASSGNAAAALAGLCASAGLRAVIFVPASAPQAKITQLLVYGATVFLVQGTYDDAFDLSVQAAETYGWYCRNTGMNPYTTEGKKTAAMEIAEQLGWRAPDVLIVSVGDGNILAGQYKGFADLHALGWINRVPRLIGVQAEGSSALVRAWEKGMSPVEMLPAPAETIADSINVGLPRDRAKALRAVRASEGAFVAVSDTEILTAIPELARETGVFAEPAAAAALAGLRRARALGFVQAGECAALLITGSGLKDIQGAIRSLDVVDRGSTSNGPSGAHPVPPAMAALRPLVNTLGLS
jgi:threonine synthase